MTLSIGLFDLVPGKVLLERYKLVAARRETGMSQAYEVEDQKVGESRELSIFPAGLFEDADQARSFSDKLDAWTGLDTPGLPKLEQAISLTDGGVALIGDLVSGSSLRSYHKQGGGPLEIEDALALGQRLLGALVDLHARGLVHGDVKPASIWFEGSTSTSMLTDGGVTGALWEAKHLGTRTALIGTPYYAPIEQFSGDAPTEASDQYNVGTVLFEALTGVLPWQGSGYIEVFQSKMEPGPPAMRLRNRDVEIPAGIEAAIARSLRAKPTERYESCADFLVALKASVD
jgi:serine/threonine protein kinase